jgi:hypothetical protein
VIIWQPSVFSFLKKILEKGKTLKNAHRTLLNASSLSLHTLRMVHWIPSNKNITTTTTHHIRIVFNKLYWGKSEKKEEKNHFFEKKSFFILHSSVSKSIKRIFILRFIENFGLQESCFCCCSWCLLRRSLSLSLENFCFNACHFFRKKINFLFVIYQKERKMFFFHLLWEIFSDKGKNMLKKIVLSLKRFFATLPDFLSTRCRSLKIINEFEKQKIFFNNQTRLKFKFDFFLRFLSTLHRYWPLCEWKMCVLMELYIDWMFTLSEIVKLVVYDRLYRARTFFRCVDNNNKFLRIFQLIILIKIVELLTLYVDICCMYTFNFLFFSNNSLHTHTPNLPHSPFHSRDFSCAAQDENLWMLTKKKDRREEEENLIYF